MEWAVYILSIYADARRDLGQVHRRKWVNDFADAIVAAGVSKNDRC